jgi:hypothetical protein
VNGPLDNSVYQRDGPGDGARFPSERRLWPERGDGFRRSRRRDPEPGRTIPGLKGMESTVEWCPEFLIQDTSPRLLQFSDWLDGGQTSGRKLQKSS